MNYSRGSRNPFVKAGTPPKTQKAGAVFLDLLGFREQMRTAYASGEATLLLRTLRVAWEEAGRRLTQMQSSLLYLTSLKGNNRTFQHCASGTLSLCADIAEILIDNSDAEALHEERTGTW